MTKTAMQELWEYIEANYNEENFNILDAKEKSLEIEKQQIVNAFNDGRRWNNSWTGETYYKELFENPNTLGR
jgi:hypothetical protein